MILTCWSRYGTATHGHMGLAHAQRSAPVPAVSATTALEPSG